MKFGLLISIATWVAAQASAGNAGFMQHELAVSNDQANPLDELRESYSKDEPEGGSGGPMRQTTVVWSGESKVPKSVQWCLAGLWVLMLASLPFIVPILDKRAITKTQMIVGSVMLVVLFGGFYLFTNIILFQSGHFKTIRPLTTVECIYFMSQIITTVGYGDITPAKIRGQVFVGLYVLGALFVIAMLISDVTAHIVKMAREHKEKRKREDHSVEQEEMTVATLVRPPRPSLWPLLTSMGVFCAIDICWITFFSCYPGEGKTVFQAAYMSVITLSSVGLGFFTPITECGMIFGAFFMLFGTASLVSVITNFTELMIKVNAYERFGEEEEAQAMNLLKKQMKENSEEVTELDFWRFTLLQNKIVQPAVLDHIREAFKRMDLNGNGILSFHEIENAMGSKASPRSSPKADTEEKEEDGFFKVENAAKAG